MDGVFSNYTDLAITARDAFVTAQIPEPGTWALMGLGLAAVAGAARVSRMKTSEARADASNGMVAARTIT